MPRAPGGPRVRYIALRVHATPGPARRALIQAIRDTGRRLHGEAFEQESGIWLTRYKGTHALVRCHHTHQDDVRAVLDAVETDPDGDPLRLESIATSGTIRTLVTRHVPQLKEPPNHLRRTKNGPRATTPGNGGPGNGTPRRRPGRNP